MNDYSYAVGPPVPTLSLALAALAKDFTCASEADGEIRLPIRDVPASKPAPSVPLGQRAPLSPAQRKARAKKRRLQSRARRACR